MNIFRKIFKHKHKWEKSKLMHSLYEEGWDYWYNCKCGAIKRKYMSKEEELLESKGE